MKNENLKDLKRNDIFKINPRELDITWSDNPRTDYGTQEEMEEMKNSIKAEGVRTPITVFWNTDKNKYTLAHGFRRMKATMELIQEGVDIQYVQCFKVKPNMEEILFDHLTLNTGKQLTDLEKSETFKQLVKYGYDVKVIAQRVGMSLQKVQILLNFAQEATQELKETVKSKKASMTAAIEVVKASKGSSNKQREILAKANETAKDSKIKVKDVSTKEPKEDNTHKKLVELSQKIESKRTKALMNHIVKYVDGKIDEPTIIALLEAMTVIKEDSSETETRKVTLLS